MLTTTNSKFLLTALSFSRQNLKRQKVARPPQGKFRLGLLEAMLKFGQVLCRGLGIVAMCQELLQFALLRRLTKPGVIRVT